ncbi:MAG: DnaD domain protein [Thermacetogeniaceae bacterium]|nr:DnaD domain protein [Syntrophomonadaceae bacterium]
MEDGSRMASRLHIPALFSRDFFAEGFTVIPNLLIRYSGRLGLDGIDLLVMMSFCYFQQRGQYELEISDFARLTNVSEELIQRSIEKLHDLGLLTDKDHSLDPTGLFEKLADLWAEEKMHHAFKQSQEMTTPQIKAVNELRLSPILQIIHLFEREFGRALTAIEVDQIKCWYYQDGYSDTLIKEALKRAVLRGILNLNYMDRILSSWAKNNLKTTDEIIKYEEKFLDKKRHHKGAAVSQNEKYKDIYLT